MAHLARSRSPLAAVALLLAVALVLVAGCSSPSPKSDGAVADLKQTADKTALAEARAADKAVLSDAALCTAAALAAEALQSGTKILKGVTLPTSTAIGDILATPTQYTGKVVRIEGLIVEICQTAGCYATLKDKQGNLMNLKVGDGTLDFRKVLKLGQYAIGEGLPTPTGEHGAQVFIENHGAVVGSRICAALN